VRACCAFDGATSGTEVILEVEVRAWFCDVPQPAKAETTSAAMTNSLLPRRFRKVSIAVSCENSLFSLFEVLDLCCWLTSSGHNNRSLRIFWKDASYVARQARYDSRNRAGCRWSDSSVGATDSTVSGILTDWSLTLLNPFGGMKVSTGSSFNLISSILLFIITGAPR